MKLLLAALLLLGVAGALVGVRGHLFGAHWSCRCRPERNAAACLKAIASSQADFREHDRDGNGVKDYWRKDVAGLHTLAPAGEPIKLIESSLAAADADATAPAPKAGYLLRALPHAGEKPGALDPQRFAVCAYPADYPRPEPWTFVLGEAGTVWRRDLGRPGPPEVFPDDDTLKREWERVD